MKSGQGHFLSQRCSSSSQPALPLKLRAWIHLLGKACRPLIRLDPCLPPSQPHHNCNINICFCNPLLTFGPLGAAEGRNYLLRVVPLPVNIVPGPKTACKTCQYSAWTIYAEKLARGLRDKVECGPTHIASNPKESTQCASEPLRGPRHAFGGSARSKLFS